MSSSSANIAAVGDDFALERVPIGARRPMRDLLWIELGMVTATSEFVLAATLGYSMTLVHAMIAVLIGTAILIALSATIGLMGTREGLPSGLLARWCGFGDLGAGAISLCIVVGNVAWFGVQNAICASAIQRATGGRLSFVLASTLTGIVLIIIAALGFKSLARTAGLVVPLFVVVAGYGTYKVLAGTSFSALLHSAPLGPHMSIVTGVGLVVGSFVVGAVLTPDLSRFCRKSSDVVWVMAISLIVGQVVLGMAGVVLAHAARTQDVVAIIFNVAGWLGVAVVFLATLKLNDVNLYSCSLHLMNMIQIIFRKEVSRTLLTVAAGAVGTLFSVLGILNHIVQFLTLLGLTLTPVAGILAVDYFVVHPGRVAAVKTREELKTGAGFWYPGAFAAWVCGALAAYFVHGGVPSLTSIVVAAGVYMGWSFCFDGWRPGSRLSTQSLKKDQAAASVR